MSESVDVAVVGAGISGLLAATVMAESGLSVCVLDKGRGVGGRMATRRRDRAVFDHGAQFFTVRDERFAPWARKWKELDLVREWYSLGESGVHYRGVLGMTVVAKHLATDLDVRLQTPVRNVRFQSGRWAVESDGGLIESRALLLTAPVPQSLALLEGTPLAADDLASLRAIEYRRCIAALAILEQPSSLETHGGSIKLEGEPIQWIADNQRKGISEIPAVTIHSAPAFAETHWDSPDAERLPPMIEAAAPYIGAEVVSCEGHRWGFSEPVRALDSEAYVEPGLRLAIAGDGPAGGRVEGAAVSGLEAGRQLVALLSAAQGPILSQ